jgi:hypothetical protein
MTSRSSNAKRSEASATEYADTISQVGIHALKYYFEVGTSVDRTNGHFVGNDGTLVSSDSDLTRIRTFGTLRAADQFFDMMNGRYGGRPLHLRSNIRMLPSL